MYDVFFFSSRRRHTRCLSDWSSDVCSSDLTTETGASECLAAAGLPASEVKAWLQAEPGETTDFPADREKFSGYWRTSARLIGRLPPKARRNASEQAAATVIQDAARDARVRFLRCHGH